MKPGGKDSGDYPDLAKEAGKYRTFKSLNVIVSVGSLIIE